MYTGTKTIRETNNRQNKRGREPSYLAADVFRIAVAPAVHGILGSTAAAPFSTLDGHSSYPGSGQTAGGNGQGNGGLLARHLQEYLNPLFAAVICVVANSGSKELVADSVSSRDMGIRPLSDRPEITGMGLRINTTAST